MRPCDLCSATESLDTPDDPSGKIRICYECGFVHVKERRSVEEVANAWEQIYATGGYDPDWPGVKARLFYVAQWMDSNFGLRDRTVLDIGCGNGNFLGYCKSLGAVVSGLDPSGDNCRVVADKGIPCHRVWAGDGSPDIGQFDFVTLTWTLENTADCLEVLRYAKRQLKPDGRVVVATGSRILVPFKKPLHTYIPQDPDYPHDTHCYRWSAKSLARAAQAIGLKRIASNDYAERDELVVAFDVDTGPFVRSERVKGDNPNNVRRHFERWQEMFS